MQTPRELVDIEIRVLRTMFDVQKEIFPMVVFFRDGDRAAMPVPIFNDYEKGIASQVIREIVAMTQPDAVVYFSEAWLLVIDKDKVLKELPRPSESKDRVEVVMAHFEFKTGEKISATARILRSGADDPTLGEFEIVDDQTIMGLFADLYPQDKKNLQ